MFDLLAKVQMDAECLDVTEQGVHNLHGVLRLREDALVLLGHQTDALLLEPSAGVVGAEHGEGAPHELLAAWIDFLQVGDTAEGVGQVAASATCNGDLCQRLALALVEMDFGRWQHPLQVDGAETACRACTNDGNSQLLSHCGLEKVGTMV